MIRPNAEVDIDSVPLVSMDGVQDFTSMSGRFYQEFGTDAIPLIDWANMIRTWIKKVRAEFGQRLRHAAVVSHYTYGQFRNPSWNKADVHPLLGLCTNDSSRAVTIDDPRTVQVIPKNSNDATASQAFLDFVNSISAMVFAGVTTTSCVTATLTSLLDHMGRGAVNLQGIVVARDGFAGRRNRETDARRILDELARHDKVIMVPTLNDIRWVDRSRR